MIDRHLHWSTEGGSGMGQAVDVPFSTISVRPLANATGWVRTFENHLGFVADALSRMLADLPSRDSAPRLGVVVTFGDFVGHPELGSSDLFVPVGAQVVDPDTPDDQRIHRFLDVLVTTAVNAASMLGRDLDPLLHLDLSLRQSLQDTAILIGDVPLVSEDLNSLLVEFFRTLESGRNHVTLRLVDQAWKVTAQADFSVADPAYTAQAFHADVAAAISAGIGQGATD